MPTDVDIEEGQQGGSGGSDNAQATPPAAPQAAAPDDNTASGAAPSGNQNDMAAPGPTNAQVNPSMARKVYDTAMNIFGGGTPTRPTVDPATGKISNVPIPRGEPGNKPGDGWRHIIAAAFTGMAGAATAPTKVGAPVSAGIGAGFGAEQKAQQQQQDRGVAQAQQGFENNQKMEQEKRAQSTAQSNIDLQAAERARLTVETASQIFQLNRAKVVADEDATKLFNSFHEATNVPGAVNLGEFNSVQDVIEYEKAHPELSEQIAGGRVVLGDEVDGKGNHKVVASVVPNEIMKQPLSQVFSGGKIPPVAVYIPGPMKNGKVSPGTIEYHEPSPNTPYGDFMNMNDRAVEQKQKEMLNTASINKANAETGEAAARTEQIYQQIHATTLAAGQDPFGNPVQVPPGKNGIDTFNKRVDTFRKAEVLPLEKLDKTFAQFQGILGDVASGKDLNGAQSVIGLFDAIGISAEPLAGKGFRVNSNTIDEHREALGMGDKAYRFFAGLKSGAVVTPTQLQQYAQEAIRARNVAYREAAGAAMSQHLPVDFMPHGFNQPVDGDTAKMFLDIAGGDVQKAANSLAYFGWGPPVKK